MNIFQSQPIFRVHYLSGRYIYGLHGEKSADGRFKVV